MKPISAFVALALHSPSSIRAPFYVQLKSKVSALVGLAAGAWGKPGTVSSNNFFTFAAWLSPEYVQIEIHLKISHNPGFIFTTHVLSVTNIVMPVF